VVIPAPPRSHVLAQPSAVPTTPAHEPASPAAADVERRGPAGPPASAGPSYRDLFEPTLSFDERPKPTVDKSGR
jgi:hypothetical protein